VLAVSVAERIVSVCLQARAGERVAVVTDEMPGHELVGALAASLRARGAEALVVAAERLPSTPHGYLSWVDPSTAVLALLSECDAAVFYTSTLSALAEGVRAVAARGTRMLFVPADLDLHRPFVLTEDLDALDTLGSRVCARLRTARELRLTTPEGTDLSLQTGGALGYDDCRAVEAGAIDFFPGGMWNLVPDVGSVEGVVRFCASLHPVGRLVEPVELEFSGGLVTSIHGGWQARAWQRWLDGFGESDVTRFAHLSGGLAAQAQVIGHDWEDLVVRGSVLVSGGASLLYGGGNAAPAHFDGIIPEATLVADGVPVLTSGTYAEDLLPDRVPRRDGQVAP